MKVQDLRKWKFRAWAHEEHIFEEAVGTAHMQGTRWFRCSCGRSGSVSENPYVDWESHVKQANVCAQEDNAVLAAPAMLEALKAQHEAIDRLFAMLIQRDPAFFPSQSGQPWEAMQQGNRAVAQAEKGDA